MLKARSKTARTEQRRQQRAAVSRQVQAVEASKRILVDILEGKKREIRALHAEVALLRDALNQREGIFRVIEQATAMLRFPIVPPSNPNAADAAGTQNRDHIYAWRVVKP